MTDKKYVKWIELKKKFWNEVLTEENYDEIYNTENVSVDNMGTYGISPFHKNGHDWCVAIFKDEDGNLIDEFNFYVCIDERVIDVEDAEYVED